MANIEVKLRRGTEAEHDTTNGGFTGAEGEVTVDTTNDTLRVHDGSTAGGIRLAKLSEVSGGTGTVTSVDSGTGLTGGPITTSGTLSIADNGVTFAKMQDINTAKVIGRTTAGSGDPEEVSILDEDAMTSNSATALATQQSIKAYVDAQVVSKHSTGWQTSFGGVTVANGATLIVTHNLGTTDVQVAVYVNTSASDSGVTEVSGQDNWSTSDFGASVTNLTSNNITLQLGSSGYTTTDSSGVFSAASYASAYLKVVVIG
jgi:hypothetical protein